MMQIWSKVSNDDFSSLLIKPFDQIMLLFAYTTPPY
jgi:hypothetical protein